MTKPDDKTFTVSSDLHRRAIALEGPVVERFCAPDGHEPGGPGAAAEAGIALLEAVVRGDYEIVPAAHMREYETRSLRLDIAMMVERLLTTLVLSLAMRLAESEGADDFEAMGNSIAAVAIRELVEGELLPAAAEAGDEEAPLIRGVARALLQQADELSARAVQIKPPEGLQ